MSLNAIPRELLVFFEDAIMNPKSWTKSNCTPVFFSKLLKGKEYDIALNLFNKLDGSDFNVASIYAVYNPLLASSFCLTTSKMESRATTARELFFVDRWLDDRCGEEKMKLRKKTKQALEERCAQFDWNSKKKLPILPVLHGTSTGTAWKICASGFATLSLIDAGFYGSGIYFTTSAQYTLPYFISTIDPCVIISLLIPGNAYPVIEHPQKPEESLTGRTLFRGYQSHYVRTSLNGMPITSEENEFDEIVINQESQVCPLFIVQIDNGSNLHGYLQKFKQTEENFTSESNESSRTELQSLLDFSETK